MLRSKIFFFLAMIITILYIGALSYFHRFYNEKRWIPRVVLDLPNFQAGDSLVFTPVDASAPDIFPASQDDDAFQVFFDTTPLPAVSMIRPWNEENSALQTYAKPFTDIGEPKIVLILTEVGLNTELFVQAIQKLPTVVNLSFSPYAPDLPKKIEYARMHGFENLLDLPVQSSNGYADGGKYALSVDVSSEQINELLQKYYFGLNVPFVGFFANDNFLVDEAQRTDFYQKNILPYGLTFLSADSVDSFYRENFYKNAVIKALEKAEEQAVQKGSYILVLPIHPIVVDVLVEWVGLKFHSKVSFVPLSVLKGSLL